MARHLVLLLLALSMVSGSSRVGRAQVTLRSNNKRALLQHSVDWIEGAGPGVKGVAMTGNRWENVCAPPCGLRLDRRDHYRIGGDGIIASSSFDLPPGQGPVVLDVRVGRRDLRIGGFVLIGLGVAGTGAGMLLLLISSDLDAKRQGGAAAFGVGLGTLGAGIALALLSRTRVSVLEPGRLALRVQVPGGMALSSDGLIF
jgi:hypothetical protein